MSQVARNLAVVLSFVLGAASAPAAAPIEGDPAKLIWRSERVCGVNCAYLLLKHNGVKADYRALEDELIHEDLTSLAEIKRTVRQHGLSAIIARTDRRGLAEVPKPLIAHLESVSGRGATNGHFVLVTSTDDQGVHCVDGTTAIPRDIPWPEFETDWSGHIVFIERGRTLQISMIAVFVALGLTLGALIRALVAPIARIRGRIAGGPAAAGAAAILVLGLISTVGTASAADAPTLDSIAGRYKQRYAQVKTLRADYRIEEAALIDRARFFRLTGQYEFPASQLSSAISDKGAIYSKLTSQRHELNEINAWLAKFRRQAKASATGEYGYADIAVACKDSKPTPYGDLTVFDGTKLFHRGSTKLAPMGVESPVIEVIEISRLKSAYFPDSSLGFDLWAYPTPGLPHDNEMKRMQRIPDLFGAGPFEVSAKLERVGDDDCVVIQAPGVHKIWLLPGKDFSPRKRVYYFKGEKVVEAEFTDHKKLGSGAWIAGTIVTVDFGVKGFVPSDLEGVATKRTTYRLEKSEVNAPATEALFSMKPAVGDIVIDETLVEKERLGKLEKHDEISNVIPSVSYIVPARSEDLDRVIADAIEEDRNRDRLGWLRSPLLWGNVVVVTLIAVAMVVRRNRKRVRGV